MVLYYSAINFGVSLLGKRREKMSVRVSDQKVDNRIPEKSYATCLKQKSFDFILLSSSLVSNKDIVFKPIDRSYVYFTVLFAFSVELFMINNFTRYARSRNEIKLFASICEFQQSLSITNCSYPEISYFQHPKMLQFLSARSVRPGRPGKVPSWKTTIVSNCLRAISVSFWVVNEKLQLAIQINCLDWCEISLLIHF